MVWQRLPSYAMLAALDDQGVCWSITCQQNNKVKALLADIGEDTCTSIDYPEGAMAIIRIPRNRSRNSPSAEPVRALAW